MNDYINLIIGWHFAAVLTFTLGVIFTQLKDLKNLDTSGNVVLSRLKSLTITRAITETKGWLIISASIFGFNIILFILYFIISKYTPQDQSVFVGTLMTLLFILGLIPIAMDIYLYLRDYTKIIKNCKKRFLKSFLSGFKINSIDKEIILNLEKSCEGKNKLKERTGEIIFNILFGEHGL